MTTVTDTTRMSHAQDPHTSKEAAVKASTGTKKALLYGAILYILTDEPATPGEIAQWYGDYRDDIAWFPAADLYDIRRRMSELFQDNRIEPIQVGTHKDGSPQYMTREGQRVMRLVVES
jgi:hypothetical protein